MFQVAVDDAHDTDRLPDLATVDQCTVATYQQIDLHTCTCGLIQLVHHHGIGDMVHLHLDISGQSSSLVLDLLINQSDELLFHLVGRY